MTHHALLNDAPDVRVVQHPERLTTRLLEPVDQLLLILPERVPQSVWNTLPQGARLKAVARKRGKSEGTTFLTRLANKRQTLVIGGSIPATSTVFEQLDVGRKLLSTATADAGGCIGICVLGFSDKDAAAIASNVLAATLAAAFPMPNYGKAGPTSKTRTVRLLGLGERIDTARVEAEAHGNNLARWLTSMPPNKLDARNYADILRALAKHHDWEYRRLSTKDLRTLGAGAFLAVAQGNADDSACIVRLRRRPGKKSAKADLSLVGKGIVFDTGGNNLKPFQSMLDMHGDMQGSAVAVGTLLAMTLLDLPHAVDCWLAITENRIGPEAYKSRDVVTAANGKTIQTIHTDAEGRMALADTLVLASRDEPGMIVDYATLTGAAINAITKRYSAVFTNRPDWHPRLKRTGVTSGERVWPFPIGPEFVAELASDVADLKQCAIQATGDHILAASFLNEFVDSDIPWVHIDLSAGDIDGGLGHIPTKVTGFGVRYTLSLLLDEKLPG